MRPLTSKVAKSKNIPGHVLVDLPRGGLKTPSVILCNQLRTISKDRLGKAPWGPVSILRVRCHSGYDTAATGTRLPPSLFIKSMCATMNYRVSRPTGE
jgi:hypothetical protein